MLWWCDCCLLPFLAVCVICVRSSDPDSDEGGDWDLFWWFKDDLKRLYVIYKLRYFYASWISFIFLICLRFKKSRWWGLSKTFCIEADTTHLTVRRFSYYWSVVPMSCVVCRVSCVVCRVSCVVCRVSCVVCRVLCVVHISKHAWRDEVRCLQ